jgi:hypothetical protein
MSLLAIAAIAVACLITPSDAQLNYRNPVVLSIAPDVVDCDDPDDPDGVEDVQIAGICFRGDIVAAFLTLNADGSGDRIALGNVVNVGPNMVVATVPLSQLTERDTPYYVFLVRADGKESTPYPNAFGYDVTFSCVAATGPTTAITLTSCRVVRTSTGRYILQVNGVGFRPNDTIILLDGEPCRTNKYPSRFINPAEGTTTRVHCTGGLEQRLPAIVTARNQSDGAVSTNSLACDFE